MGTRRTIVGVGAGVTLVAACLSGCSGHAATGPDTTTTTLRVGIVPSPLAPPLLLGMKRGYFSEQHLVIDIHYVDAGQAAVSAVAQGSLDIAGVGAEPAIAAASNAVPIRVIAGAQTAGEGAPGASSVYVPASSPIKTFLDLQGKSVGSNALTSTNSICLLAAVDKAGGDSKTVKVVEMPVNSTVQSLQRGQIDGASLFEPFSLQAHQAGMRNVGDPCETAFVKDSPMGAWITGAQTLQGKKSMIDRFRRALSKASAYANAHMDEAKTSLADVLKGVTADQALKMNLTPYHVGLDQAVWDSRVSLDLKYGVIKSKPNLKDLLVP